MSDQSAQLLSSYVSSLEFEDIPKETVKYAKLLISDYIASVMGGYMINKFFKQCCV